MKNILILCLLLITGCSFNGNVLENNSLPNEEKMENTSQYIDGNPIKLGLFLYDNNYHNKEVIKDVYYADFIPNMDIGSFEVFLTDDYIIDGNKFKDTWNLDYAQKYLQ